VLGFKNPNGNPSDALISLALSEMLTTELGATDPSGANYTQMY
jgi:hypothetical protein